MSKFSKIIISCLFLLFSASSFAAQVNINTASADYLAQNIKGVGQKKAEAIVIYRKKNGMFKSVNDLTKVKGIGQKIVDSNRANLLVEDVKVKKN